MLISERRLLLVLLSLVLCTSVFAASDEQLQQRFDDTRRYVNRSRGLTLSILKQIKQLDQECRGRDGTPLMGRSSEAQNRIARIKPLMEAFDVSTDESLELLHKLSRDLGKGLSSSKYDPEIRKMKDDLSKYRRHVNRYYLKTINDFGEPIAPTQFAEMPASGEQFAVTGEATIGLGSSKYKRPNASPKVSASSSDISIGINARYAQSERTGIFGRLSHKSTVQRREIGLTDFGVSVAHQLSPRASAKAGFDLSKYSDKDNDVANYSQKGIFTRFDFVTPRLRMNADIKYQSRGYSNLDNADYKTTTFTSNGTLPMGQGNLKLRLRYLKRSNDVDALDHTELNPSFVYQFNSAGSQFGVSHQQFKRPNADDSPLESNRLKLHLYMARRSAMSGKKWGPEINMYKYPNRDEADMTDFKLIYQSHLRGKRTVMIRMDAVYRRHQDTLQFDFAQFQYRRNSRPVGRGKYSRLNLAARYYLEASDKDDSLRFSNVHPPHTLDVYYGCGWQMPSASWLRTLSIGPILGTKAYFDTERSDAFDEDIVDVDFVLRNPQNNVRVGLEVAAGIAIDPGITGRAELSYIYSALYNADPIRTTSIFELKIRFSYPVNREWFVDGYTNLHSTRAEIASAADLDKSDIGVQVRYLFDVRQ
jgi:hypothetical protein